jgi:hypothetical protein
MLWEKKITFQLPHKMFGGVSSWIVTVRSEGNVLEIRDSGAGWDGEGVWYPGVIKASIDH